MTAEIDYYDGSIPEPDSIVSTPRWWRQVADSEDRKGNARLAGEYRALADTLDRYVASHGRLP